MKKKRAIRYRDGYIHFLKEKIKKNDFNAKRNSNEFIIVEKVPFNELSKRIQDKEFINLMDKQLDIKIEVPNCKMNFNDNLYIMINNDKSKIYSITYHDDTPEKYYLYLTVIGNRKDVIINRTEKST